MGQIDEVSERLNAFTSEIVGVIEKTLSDYEAQASRLKEENDRHRCLLDIIVKAKLPETEGLCPLGHRSGRLSPSNSFAK